MGGVGGCVFFSARVGSEQCLVLLSADRSIPKFLPLPTTLAQLFSANFLYPAPASILEDKTPNRRAARKLSTEPGPEPDVLRPWGADRLWEEAAGVLATIRQSLPHMAAGFLAGGTAALVSNPLDVVKTRIQTQRGKPAALAFFRGLQEVVRQEGLRKSLFRGLAPKVVSTAPLGMLSSIVYEGILFMSRKDQSPKKEGEEEGR
jgi:hypothetical protein